MVKFCDLELKNPCPFPIVFTDESKVSVNLHKGGIWRKRGEYIPESYFEKPSHPIHVLVWGAIGPGGFRSKLVGCPQTINSVNYVKFLIEEGIVDQLNRRYGEKQFIFPEDNAHPHKGARKKSDLIFRKFPFWPAQSPDLNPIEQLWAYLKNQLRGRVFTTEDELF